ncbi:MAG: hypothetical protein ACRC5T_04395 [Cetobacterium sp.]
MIKTDINKEAALVGVRIHDMRLATFKCSAAGCPQYMKYFVVCPRHPFAYNYEVKKVSTTPHGVSYCEKHFRAHEKGFIIEIFSTPCFGVEYNKSPRANRLEYREGYVFVDIEELVY